MVLPAARWVLVDGWEPGGSSSAPMAVMIPPHDRRHHERVEVFPPCVVSLPAHTSPPPVFRGITSAPPVAPYLPAPRVPPGNPPGLYHAFFPLSGAPSAVVQGVKMTTGIFRVVLVSRPLHPASSAWPHSQACRTPVGVLGSRLPRSRENSSESLRGAAQRRSRTPIQSSGSERCQQRTTRCDPCQRSLHPHLKNWVYAFAHMTEQAYTGDKQPLFQQFCQT